MKNEDIVALILATSVAILLISGSPLRYLWLGREWVDPNPNDADTYAIWKDIMNIILGMLAGYIARGKEK